MDGKNASYSPTTFMHMYLQLYNKLQNNMYHKIYHSAQFTNIILVTYTHTILMATFHVNVG